VAVETRRGEAHLGEVGDSVSMIPSLMLPTLKKVALKLTDHLRYSGIGLDHSH
jgi:hypothetical protein